MKITQDIRDNLRIIHNTLFKPDDALLETEAQALITLEGKNFSVCGHSVRGERISAPAVSPQNFREAVKFLVKRKHYETEKMAFVSAMTELYTQANSHNDFFTCMHPTLMKFSGIKHLKTNPEYIVLARKNREHFTLLETTVEKYLPTRLLT